MKRKITEIRIRQTASGLAVDMVRGGSLAYSHTYTTWRRLFAKQISASSVARALRAKAALRREIPAGDSRDVIRRGAAMKKCKGCTRMIAAGAYCAACRLQRRKRGLYRGKSRSRRSSESRPRTRTRLTFYGVFSYADGTLATGFSEPAKDEVQP